jgi:hypothetical protein
VQLVQGGSGMGDHGRGPRDGVQQGDDCTLDRGGGASLARHEVR